jgi:predicted small lipoprotein YifL
MIKTIRSASMNGKNVLQAISLIVLIFSVIGCGQSRAPLTVSEVWQNAAALDGTQIRVRGQGYFRFEPYHPLQVGGCRLDEGVVNKSHIVGKLDLLDEDSPDPKHRLSISGSSLQCEGNLCSAVCKPFAPLDTWGRIGVVEVFEFVGVLRVETQGSEVELILEDLDLPASRRMAEEKWGPIPTGVFSYYFP